MSRARTTLGELANADLQHYAAWETTGETDDGDKILEAVALERGEIPDTVGEVWCRSSCTFANGQVLPACAMYRGDSADGPLAWTVSNGERDVPLMVPPAPPFVLELDGPVAFARAFNLSIGEVFPLVIAADCRFAFPPQTRSVVIGTEGVLTLAG